MTIYARIWISDVNDKTDSISPSDCTLYEEEFADASALSRFILDRLEASKAQHGAIEQMTLTVDESRTINAYELDEPLGPGIDEWSFEADDVQRMIEEYDALMAKELSSVEASLSEPSTDLPQALQATLDALGRQDKNSFYPMYFIAYLAYLAKARELTTKKKLWDAVIEAAPIEGIQEKLTKTLSETGMSILQAIGNRFELDAIEDYLEKAWSDSPEGTEAGAAITGLEDLTLQILNLQPDESVLAVDYGEGRLLVEMAKAQPQARLIAVEDPAQEAAVAHIKLSLAQAKAEEFPVERLPVFKRTHEDLRADKICKPADPRMAGRAFPSPSPTSIDPLTMLAETGKMVAFTDRPELSAVPQNPEPVKKLVQAGRLEAVVILSDDTCVVDGESNHKGLAMVIFGHDNDGVRIVDATDLCRQARGKADVDLRTIVPKECVAQIMEALSGSSPHAQTYTLDALDQVQFVLDPKLLPFYRDSSDGLYPLSVVSRIGTGRSFPGRDEDSSAASQAEPEKFFKIKIDDIEDGTIVSGEELANDEVRRDRHSLLLGPGGSGAIDDNCLVIPLEHDAATGALSAGTVRAIKKAPTDGAYFVDGLLLLLRLNGEAADAEKVAAFLNSERGQKLMDIALKRSEHAFDPEKAAAYFGMFPMIFRDNLMIDKDAFEADFDPAASRGARRAGRPGGVPSRPAGSRPTRGERPTGGTPVSRGAERGRRLRLSDDEIDPTGVLRGIAANPETPPELLDALAHQVNSNIQQTVSKNPNTSTETLVFLANMRTGGKAMLNPKLPASFLEERALDTSRPLHHREIAANPSTPARALEHLGRSEDEFVREAVAQNAATPPSVLSALAVDNTALVREAALNNPNFPADSLEKLAASDKPALRYLAASSPQSSAELLDSLAYDVDERVRREATTNENMDADTLERLSHHEDPTTRMLVAMHPHTPESVVERLAHDDTVLGDGTSQVRFGATASAFAPVWLLEELASSDDVDVRYNLADAERTPHPILEDLARDKERSVRMAVASNPAALASVLDILSKDSDETVRRHVAENPAAPQEAVLRLAADSDKFVRRHVAERADLTSELLEQLMADEHPGVRDRVARNPLTTSEMRAKLIEDESSIVAAAAVARLPHDELLRLLEKSDAVKALTKNESQ